MEPPPSDPDPMASQRRGAALAVIATIAAIVACYLWVDRPVAYFMHDHSGLQSHWLITVTHLPELLALGSGVLLLATPLAAHNRHAAWRVAHACAVSLAIAFLLKTELKIVFGRAWPDTWTHGNPSLIHDHVYGFFWWRLSNSFHSFPSGHTSLTFAVVGVLWLAVPRWRWAAVAVGLTVGLALVVLDYHFVSDVLAGALLGSLCGAMVWQRLSRR